MRYRVRTWSATSGNLLGMTEQLRKGRRASRNHKEGPRRPGTTLSKSWTGMAKCTRGRSRTQSASHGTPHWWPNSSGTPPCAIGGHASYLLLLLSLLLLLLSLLLLLLLLSLLLLLLLDASKMIGNYKASTMRPFAKGKDLGGNFQHFSDSGGVTAATATTTTTSTTTLIAFRSFPFCQMPPAASIP